MVTRGTWAQQLWPRRFVPCHPWPSQPWARPSQPAALSAGTAAPPEQQSSRDVSPQGETPKLSPFFSYINTI